MAGPKEWAVPAHWEWVGPLIPYGWFPLPGLFHGRGTGWAEAPLKMLFERVAVPLAVTEAPGAWPGKRRLMAIDG
jgi:hypothetical protein